MSIVVAFMVPHPPIIVPEVGKGEENKISQTIDAYKKVSTEIAKLKPDTIIITSPHIVMYGDYFHIVPGKNGSGSLARFNAAEIKISVDYDEEFTQRLCDACEEQSIPAGYLGEQTNQIDHASLIPLYFILKEYSDFNVVRIGLSGLPLITHYRIGMCIKEVVSDLNRRVVFVASGDLSHKLKTDGPYGFNKEGPKYDKRIMATMSSGSFGELLEYNDSFCQEAAECGHRSFVIMAGALDRTAVKSKKLSYQDTFGVGYGICSFDIIGEDKTRNFGEKYINKQQNMIKNKHSKEDEYVRLARKTINMFISENKIPVVDDSFPEEMKRKKAGVFVSIHENGALRGCIGTIEACYSSIAEEIINNAIQASMHDPRFEPIKANELDLLEISVDVLGPIENIKDRKDLDVERYGVIVKSGMKRGLLLPNLDGITSIDQQINIACQKAGIDTEDDFELQRFEVVRHY